MKTDKMALVKQAFEVEMQKTVMDMHVFDQVPNNTVYRIRTATGDYIFKIYSSGWPEEGKLSFVTRKLEAQGIPHAKIFAYRRNAEDFPYGYLIESCLPGTTADRLILSKTETVALFEKLAILVSQIHQIPMTGYGYIGSGTAEWTSFSGFMSDSLHDNIETLKERHKISAEESSIIEREIQARLKMVDVTPAVLVHGDLSLKNVLVNGDDITLIDWDDSYALSWIADIANLTLWMKRTYGEDAALYRDAFLSRYETTQNKALFYEAEDILHVRYGLDSLSFFSGHPRYYDSIAVTAAILRKSLANCGMKALACLIS